MDVKISIRCPHYQIFSEPLAIDGSPAYLAIRRCLLTERLNRILCSSPEGKQLADKLVVQMDDGRAYAFVGPDLEAVTQQSCTVQRCESRCTPAYSQHLEYFGIEDPGEEEVTCQERDSEQEKRRPATSAGNTIQGAT